MVATGRLPSPAELDDLAAVTFRWPSGWHGFKLHRRFALGCGFQARFLAFFGLAIKCLRHRRRPAHFAQQQYVHMKVAAIVCDLQPVAYADLPRGLRGLSIGLNPAQFTRPRCKSARLEKSGSPKPFIYSHGRHKGIVL